MRIMIKLSGEEQLQNKVNRLSVVMQQRLASRVANGIVQFSKQRIDDQIDLSGVAFKARASNSNKKMLLGLKARLRVLSVSDNNAVIGFDGKTSGIAAAQQFGQITTVTAQQAKKSSGDLSKPATAQQAKKLLELGFKVGRRKPMITQIMTDCTIGQAAFLIHKLSAEQGMAIKTSWTITLVGRSFLGVANRDNQSLKQIAIDELNGAITQ